MVTVGLIGHNGSVGKSALAALAEAEKKGNLKLVVIHRPSSETSNIPAGIEKRALDNAKASDAEFDKALAGINVLVSTVGAEGLASEASFLPALKRSSDAKLFIPSDFGAPWTKQDLQDINAPFFQIKEETVAKAKELGVPVSTIKTGIFTDVVPFAG